MATPTVNNDVYRTLGDRWYDADDDPVALLRAQARLHAPWVAGRVRRMFGDGAHRVLDLGCGAGFIANDLARRGLEVIGVDAANEALEVAAAHQTTDNVRWIRADGRSLPLRDGTFDAVCAMDFLEHVQPVEDFVREASRVLRPGGLFFFHTFDRNWLAWLVVIKGVELFVRNVPPDLHLLRGFIKPRELAQMCAAHDLAVQEVRGCAPRWSPALLRLAVTGIVPRDLEFRLTRRSFTSYTGLAQKRDARRDAARR
jgi:2-polyprenyl-6-hydroxyphenyl methylase/3-demethylubiquinone-9 3-methyltransferase